MTTMPTYEYVCEKCGHQFEKIQPISSKALAVCPEDSCAQKRWGKGKVKRAISAGGKKDSAPAASTGDAKSSGGETKSAPAKTESKAESKPAKASPAKKD